MCAFNECAVTRPVLRGDFVPFPGRVALSSGKVRAARRSSVAEPTAPRSGRERRKRRETRSLNHRAATALFNSHSARVPTAPFRKLVL
ncbi:hypothetical protein SKAU_G00368150 [Synaphobranchus kaupii]|uniref:Uncharacterized protein n=1 Tax=Synaphobranchus kaupii TaxID=118154 RepID=A0A9Q1EFF9_SYNKA|nr:hypothetical protein SKAU_G00368150 [Synaphobranchus kaupii]